MAGNRRSFYKVMKWLEQQLCSAFVLSADVAEPFSHFHYHSSCLVNLTSQLGCTCKTFNTPSLTEAIQFDYIDNHMTIQLISNLQEATGMITRQMFQHWV